MDSPTAMRNNITALCTGDEKQMAVDLKAVHDSTLSIVVRAGLHKFASMPFDEQQAWIEMANQNFKREIG